MTEALLVSNVLLWILVLALSGVVLALLRQIGVLHERIAPAGALVPSQGPRVGEAAPVVEARDWAGTTLRVGGPDPARRSTLLFFLSPTCPLCKELLPVLDAIATEEGPALQVVLASDGERAEHEAFVRERGLARRPYLLSTALGLAYAVGKLPHAVLIDAEGVIRAQGLVNSREHLESLFTASELGVASVQEYLAAHSSREVA